MADRMSGVATTALRAAVARALRLGPPLTRRVDVRRGVDVVMRDGAVLRADLYLPRLPATMTVLIRTPYGRRGPLSLLCGVIAERGFAVVIQSCRGTFDSGGRFDPLVNERADGADTLRWLKHQPHRR